MTETHLALDAALRILRPGAERNILVRGNGDIEIQWLDKVQSRPTDEEIQAVMQTL